MRPNIVGALLLAAVAWIVAGIVRSVTKVTLLKSKLNERLAAQIGVERPEAVAEYAAGTAYCTVFLFFLPAILNALKIYGITQPLQAMFEKVLTYIPNLLAAVAILVVGLFVANLIRRAVSGLIVISRLNAFGEKLGVSKLFGNGGLASMVSIVAYVLVAIPVVISALTALKVEALSSSVSGFFDKLLNATGDIIGASLIVFCAVLAGGFVSGLLARLVADFGFDRLIAGMGFRREGDENSVAPSAVVGKLAFLCIVVLAVLAACEILGFEQLANLIRTLAAFGGNRAVEHRGPADRCLAGELCGRFAEREMRRRDRRRRPRGRDCLYGCPGHRQYGYRRDHCGDCFRADSRRGLRCRGRCVRHRRP